MVVQAVEQMMKALWSTPLQVEMPFVRLTSKGALLETVDRSPMTSAAFPTTVMAAVSDPPLAVFCVNVEALSKVTAEPPSR